MPLKDILSSVQEGLFPKDTWFEILLSYNLKNCNFFLVQFGARIWGK
jgi:hypothetical protein